MRDMLTVDEKTQCFYVEGAHNIIDLVTEDGRGHFGGETLDEMRQRRPGAQIVLLDAAVSAIQEVNRKRLKVGEPIEITKEKFTEMLEVLPPRFWVVGKDHGSFQMCELTCGNITACYVRLGSKYYEVMAELGTPHDKLVEYCRK